jgi:hypothetical protein
MAVLQVLVGLDLLPVSRTAQLAVPLEEEVVEVAVLPVLGQASPSLRTMAWHPLAEEEEVTEAGTVETISAVLATASPMVVCANILLLHLSLQPAIASAPPLNLLQLR